MSDDFPDAEIEAARVIFAHEALFIMGAAQIDQLPAPDLPNYAAGSHGPASWQELLKIGDNTGEHLRNEPLQISR